MNVVTGPTNLFQSWSVVAILRFTQVSTSYRELTEAIIVMVIGKEMCYDFYGHHTSISGHNIIGLIAVWYIDITEDIVAFVLAKITSCVKRVKYFIIWEWSR